MSQREILFKAKRTDNGEWAEGYYVEKVDPLLGTRKSFILNQVELSSLCHWYRVDHETVCQYTGLTDKNGKKIFEDDILNIPGTKRPGIPAPVRYLQEQCQFVISRSGYNPVWLSEYEAEKNMEVVGNIHDN